MMADRVPPSNWGITTPEQLLGNLRVAENGGDITECADALEWMLRSGRLVDREVIDYEAAKEMFRDVLVRHYELWTTGGENEARQIVDAALPDQEV